MRAPVLLVAFALLGFGPQSLAGCSLEAWAQLPAELVPATKLHTDWLREGFGPIEVTVLRQDSAFRAIDIRAGSSKQLLTRAFSSPNPSMSAELESVHAKIKAGASMGATFRAAGFEVLKKSISVEPVAVSGDLQKAFGSSAGAKARMQIYEFWVRKPGGKELFYSTVAGLDSPGVSETFSDLRGSHASSAPEQLAALKQWIHQGGLGP